MYFDYRLPPVSTKDTFSMLRYFGVNSTTNDDSSHVLSLHVFDNKRLPRISCPLTNNPNFLIKISFPGPPGYGQQSFSFAPDLLMSAVYDTKYVEYSEFALSESVPVFGSAANKPASNFPYLAFVLDNFNISPSIVNRVYNHKRGYLKIPLSPSINKINRNLKRK